MKMYQELLKLNQNKIKDFFKNSKLFNNQFEFSNLNSKCYNHMFLNNGAVNIKTVKQLKDEIPQLKSLCSQCGKFFMNPRNNSVKGLDVQMGIFLEDIIIDYLNKNFRIKAMHADKKDKRYPDCMILNTDRGILAYFEVKYHAAPFITAIHKINRYCYEGSATLDYKKIIKQLELIESDLDRPTFYLHWIDYPCLKGLFFETSEQVKQNLYNSGEEFERKERSGDYNIIHKVGYTKKFYSPLLEMGTFEEFISIIKDMKKNGIKTH
ncbi:MAG: hypothetical protein ACOCRK_05350 [bacterium]